MMKKTLSLFVFIILIAIDIDAQISILEARTLGVGSTVTIKGIITNGSELGPIRYIQDGTAATALYYPSITNNLLRGDSVQVTGTLVDFNGLLEMNPISANSLLNSGNASPNPIVLSPTQMSEEHESKLTRINGVTFALGGGTFTGGQSYTFTNMQGESATIFVRNGHPLVGQTIPISAVDLIGLTSQYQSIYQLLLRDANDIIPTASINITSPVSVSNLSENGFTLSWETDIAGSTEIAFGLTTSLELGTVDLNNNSTSHSTDLTNLEPGMIYYCQAFSVAGADTAFSAITPFGTVSLSTGEIIAYFNSSYDPTYATEQEAQLLYHSIDDTLIAYINRCEYTLDLTIYDFDNTNISNIAEAINAAYDRGVQVRFISDAEQDPTNLGVLDLNPGIQRIISPIGESYNIMHNKFVIIDAFHEDPTKPIVWTGSTNWTDRQINRDPNSVIIVQDQTLAKAYTLEFNEMWGSAEELPDLNTSKFGQFKTNNTPHEFLIGGKRVECYFSPSDATNNELLNTMAAAQHNIYFASMLVTRNDLAAELVNQFNAGIDVKGVIDDSLSTLQYDVLISGLGYDRLKDCEDSTVYMHHKYMIVDVDQPDSDPTLWVGSHNWSNSANTRNDENTLVIHDINLVNQYYQEFMARFQQLPIDTATAPDIEAPEITCSENILIELLPPANFTTVTVPVPTATDNVSVFEITSDYNGTSEVSGIFFPGETVITYTATDPSGNTATCTTSVTVVVLPDEEAPQITCPDDILLTITSPQTSAEVIIDVPSVSDNVGVTNLSNNINQSDNASGEYPVGTTTVEYTATDAAGNTTSCSFTVTIEVTQSVFESANTSFTVYPNPAHSTIQVNCPQGTNRLRILDITGKVVMDKQCKPGTNSLDIASLSNGIYFIEINQNQSIKRIRFSKN